MQTSDDNPHLWRNASIAGVVLLALGISAYSLIGLKNERSRAEDLASTNQSLRDSLARVQDQLQSVSTRLETLAQPSTSARTADPSATPSAPKPSTVKPSGLKPSGAKAPKTRAKSTTPSANELRLKQMQDRLAEQQKQIDSAQQDIASGRQDLASTREDVDKTRQDLNGRLDSTRDELSGSIAKTHDQLVALERRGERNYFEFQLSKSKQFQRVGSLSLSVRKVDFKHKSYDLTLVVNDQKLDKKHVNIYEPISVRPSDQPVELVVNEIDSKQIKGYVSEPKYKPAAAPSLSSSNKNTADQ